jgi:hypothetical protein
MGFQSNTTCKEKRGDVFLGTKPSSGPSCFSNEGSCVAKPQPPYAGSPYHGHQHGNGTWELPSRVAGGLWYEHLNLHFAFYQFDWSSDLKKKKRIIWCPTRELVKRLGRTG